MINDWLDNEQIDATYQQHCYREAIRHVPEDLRAYSSIVDDITAAGQQAVRKTPPVRTTQAHQSSSNTKNQANQPQRGLFKVAFDKLGPRNADSVPLPLLILAGLAMLLIAAGAAGVVARRLRTPKCLVKALFAIRPTPLLVWLVRSPTAVPPTGRS